MDSLTQIVLGAAVGEAVLGKKMGNHAMLWGAIAGTIPDLDVFVKYFTDPITATEMHRGFSHSFVFSVLMAPILGWLVHKLYRKRKDVSIKNWSWMFFWCLVTHPLLDAHTTWGTQFFWPFEYRIAYKNIFVADPLYTIPFLIFLLLAIFHRKSNPRRQKFNKIGLIVSSSYMLLTLIFKGIGYGKFKTALDEQKIDYVEMDTRPTPLNTILWNAQVETETGYRMGYYSLFDTKKIKFSQEFPKNHTLLEPYKDQKVVKQLTKIAAGWYLVEKGVQDTLIFTDIRFGQFGFEDDSPFFWKYKLWLNADSIVEAKETRDKENINFSLMKKGLKEIKERAKGN